MPGRRFDPGADSQLRDVLQLDGHFADQFLAAAHQHEPLVRELDDELHLAAVDASPAVLDAARDRQGQGRSGLARRRTAARHHVGADADAETAHALDVGIDLADQFLSAPQCDKRYRLDLDDVF
jgi:hypothetical protein